MSKRTPPLFVVLLLLMVVLTILVPVSITWHRDSADVLQRSQNSLQTCEELATKISELRGSMPQQDEAEQDQSVFLQTVRQNMQSAVIEEGQLGDVRMRGTTPIPNSRYAREEATVLFKRVDLEKLFAFISQYQTNNKGTICSGIDLGISGAPGESTMAQWEAVLTLTRLTKTATSPKPR
jgi:hypothetical protein